MISKTIQFFTTVILTLTVAPALANIPSVEYVDNRLMTKADNSALESKVDTSATANQTMAGTYTVSGTMNFTGATTVPTAPLPSAE